MIPGALRRPEHPFVTNVKTAKKIIDASGLGPEDRLKLKEQIFHLVMNPDQPAVEKIMQRLEELIAELKTKHTTLFSA